MLISAWHFHLMIASFRLSFCFSRVLFFLVFLFIAPILRFWGSLHVRLKSSVICLGYKSSNRALWVLLTDRISGVPVVFSLLGAVRVSFVAVRSMCRAIPSTLTAVEAAFEAL